ncbi:MAG: M67 family metallopeptidase [Chloroflexota bacterium]|nr:MAG: M67 family metallopeptidase [Chloroflexota bacterium]
MPNAIELPLALYEAMLQQLCRAYPLEGCGLLAGQADRVRRVYPVSNIRKSPAAYEMDPAEQLAAMIDMEERDWELLAIYHSHPHGPQVPSSADVSQAYYPEAAYVIVSLADRRRPRARAFTIISEQIGEIPFKIV